EAPVVATPAPSEPPSPTAPAAVPPTSPDVSPASTLPPAPVIPAPAPAPVIPAPTPVTRPPLPLEGDDSAPRVRCRRRRWRAFAALLILLIVSAAGLVAAWRFAPERVPPRLQPAELMRAAGIATGVAPARRPAPPESQFDEGRICALMAGAKKKRGRPRGQGGVERKRTRQRIVLLSPAAAVIGLPALITVASMRPVVAPSVRRAATPTPATSVAQMSDTTTIFRWVIRSAVKSEELFIVPSPR